METKFGQRLQFCLRSCCFVARALSELEAGGLAGGYILYEEFCTWAARRAVLGPDGLRASAWEDSGPEIDASSGATSRNDEKASAPGDVEKNARSGQWSRYLTTLGAASSRSKVAALKAGGSDDNEAANSDGNSASGGDHQRASRRQRRGLGTDEDIWRREYNMSCHVHQYHRERLSLAND